MSHQEVYRTMTKNGSDTHVVAERRLRFSILRQVAHRKPDFRMRSWSATMAFSNPHDVTACAALMVANDLIGMCTHGLRIIRYLPMTHKRLSFRFVQWAELSGSGRGQRPSGGHERLTINRMGKRT